ncbi:hypothetical protein SRHO_G00101730 [Serrasalmus rhombeus]
MAFCTESSSVPSVHFPTVHNHITDPPSHQGDCITMVKLEEIKCEDVVSEISSTQTSSATLCTNPSPSVTHEERMASCSESSPAPTVHIPAVLIHFHNHIKKPPSQEEDYVTMLKPEEIKSEDVVSEISHTQSSATLHTNTSPKHTHDEEKTTSCSESFPAPTVHLPAVLIYFNNHIKKPPSHEEECITMLKTEDIKCEEDVSEISSTETSSATGCTKPSQRRTQENTDEALNRQCSECGRSFDTLGHLQVHQLSHTGERPYPCLWCEKSFTKPNNLKQHQLVHTGEKPYRCLECGQSFARQSHLKRHQRIHTGEKPFHCSECGQCFTRQTHLRSHQNIHTRENLYRCPVCGQSFLRQCDVQRHQRFHTGGKLYHCSECGKSFRDNGTLRAHLCIRAGEKS